MSATVAIQPRSAGETRALVRTMLGTPVVLAGLLVCLTFCLCCLHFSDPDAWWHLKVGQEVWNTHTVPTADHWSFTVYGRPWLPHEWLSDLFLYAIFHFFGYAGLQLWLGLAASAIVVLSYALCYRYCGDATVAALGGFLTFFFGSIGFSIRPQVIGYLFLVVELLLLQRAFSGKPRTLWCMPALFAVWVNCHGSYPLGLGIFVAAVACWCWRYRCVGRHVRFLAAVALLSAAALLCNPVGWRLLTYPFDALLHQQEGLNFSQEWLPTTIQDVRGLGLVLVVAAIGVAALAGRARASLFELLVFVPVTVLAIQHLRMLFVFGIVCAPLAARIVADLRGPRAPSRDHLPTNAVLLGLIALLCFAMFPSAGKIEADIDARNPVEAVQFIRQGRLAGPMMNDYKFGGYLVWALPEHKVFIDGRADVFDWAGVLRRYRQWVSLESDPERLLDDYRIGFCLLPADGAQAQVMRHLAGWRRAYSDGVAAVFVRSEQAEGSGATR